MPIILLVYEIIKNYIKQPWCLFHEKVYLIRYKDELFIIFFMQHAQLVFI